MNYHIFQCNFCGQKIRAHANKPWRSIEIHPSVDCTRNAPEAQRQSWDVCSDCFEIVTKALENLRVDVNERCGAEPESDLFGPCSLRASHRVSSHIDSDGNVFYFAKKKDIEIDKLREELAALKNQSQSSKE